MSAYDPSFLPPLTETTALLRTLLDRSKNSFATHPFHQRLAAIRRRLDRDVIPIISTISHDSDATAIASDLAATLDHMLPLLSKLLSILVSLIKTCQTTALYVSLLTAASRIYYLLEIPEEQRGKGETIRKRVGPLCAREWIAKLQPESAGATLTAANSGDGDGEDMGVSLGSTAAAPTRALPSASQDSDSDGEEPAPAKRMRVKNCDREGGKREREKKEKKKKKKKKKKNAIDDIFS